MANNKRGRPKNRRSGCLLCKPWKMNRVATESGEGEAFSDHKRRIAAGDEMREPLDEEEQEK